MTEAWLVDIGATNLKVCPANDLTQAEIVPTPQGSVQSIRDAILAMLPQEPVDIYLACQMHGFFDEKHQVWVPWHAAEIGMDTWSTEAEMHYLKVTGLKRRPTLPVNKLRGAPPRRVWSLSEALLTERWGVTHATMACGLGWIDIQTCRPVPSYCRCPTDDVVVGLWGAATGRLGPHTVRIAVGDMLAAHHALPAAHALLLNVGTGCQVLGVGEETRPTVAGGVVACTTQLPGGLRLQQHVCTPPEAVRRWVEAIERAAPQTLYVGGGVLEKNSILRDQLAAALPEHPLHLITDITLRGLQRIAQRTLELDQVRLPLVPLRATAFTVCDVPVEISHDPARFAQALAAADVTITDTRISTQGANQIGVVADETTKSLEKGLASIIKELVERQVNKKSVVAVVGGGTIQDVGGFVCHTFKRGVPWHYFPTTLLAMCDSCVGGKVGINVHGIKNVLGAFAQPQRIFIHPPRLATLAKGHMWSGKGEVLKFALLAGEEQTLLRHHDNINFVLALSLGVKKVVVEADPFDHGLRLLLGAGHTVGHALEAASRFKLPHGVAVALGLLVEDALVDNVLEHNLAAWMLARLVCLAWKDLLVHEKWSWPVFEQAIWADKKNTQAQTLTLAVPASEYPRRYVLANLQLNSMGIVENTIRKVITKLFRNETSK